MKSLCAAAHCRFRRWRKTCIAITVFKYSDTAMKAMTENPQDRGAAAAKLAEAFGGRFSSGGDYDGMVVWLLPNDQAETYPGRDRQQVGGNLCRISGEGEVQLAELDI